MPTRTGNVFDSSVRLSSDRNAAAAAATIYVGNIHYNASEATVAEHFQGCGAIERVTLKKGFGFVEFRHANSVNRAINQLNGTNFMGRSIMVCTYRQPGGTHQGPASPDLLVGTSLVKELNVLILGETGVGKSTWINSIVNYTTFPTLNEAIAYPQLEWLITSSFWVPNKEGKKYVQTEVKVGKVEEDEHENTAVGESCTQYSRPYVITTSEGTVIRLIDTPGIGDTRGRDQDQINFENILHVINRYDVLHGIIILLKPNESRLTVMFRFVVEELLTHLHKSAAQNIVFGFTNTRTTHYRPGDTYPMLEKHLTELANRGGGGQVRIPLTIDNVYNFDSESFRYLAALKQGINLGERDDYRKSWIRSVAELSRMIAYMSTLRPHRVHDTQSLNSCRRLITELTKPMAEISRLITLNIKLAESERKDLAETTAKGGDLLRKLKVKRIDLRTIELSQPVTVCAKSECIEVRTYGDRPAVTIYKQRCHNPCYLSNVRVDTTNTAELLNCAAISNSVCRICGHGYQNHMHVMYNYEEVEVEVNDEGIDRKIKESATESELKKTAIETRNRLVAEYRAEQVIIEKANAKFGHYLKENAIVPYNDARLAYLEHMIKQEEEKTHVLNKPTDEPAMKRVREVIESLKTSMREYREYVAILDAAMKPGGEGGEQPLKEPHEVMTLAESLFQLKHFGQALKDNKDGVVRAFQQAGISGNPLVNEVVHQKKVIPKRVTPDAGLTNNSYNRSRGDRSNDNNRGRRGGGASRGRGASGRGGRSNGAAAEEAIERGDGHDRGGDQTVTVPAQKKEKSLCAIQ